MKQKQSNPADVDLKQLAEEEIEPFHYARTMARTREIMQRRKPMIIAVKRTAIASGIVVALFIALLLIPASYSVDVGSVVKAQFNITDEAAIKPVMDAVASLDGVCNRSMSVKNDLAEFTLVFKDIKAYQAEREVKDRLSKVLDDNANLQITAEPITKLLGGNALAAVTGGKIRIAVENLPDDQIEAIIASELAAKGLMVRTIDVQTDRSHDGQIQREIRIEAELPEGIEPNENGEYEFQFDFYDEPGEGENVRIIKNKEIRREGETSSDD